MQEKSKSIFPTELYGTKNSCSYAVCRTYFLGGIQQINPNKP